MRPTLQVARSNKQSSLASFNAELLWHYCQIVLSQQCHSLLDTSLGIDASVSERKDCVVQPPGCAGQSRLPLRCQACGRSASS